MLLLGACPIRDRFRDGHSLHALTRLPLGVLFQHPIEVLKGRAGVPVERAGEERHEQACIDLAVHQPHSLRAERLNGKTMLS